MKPGAVHRSAENRLVRLSTWVRELQAPLCRLKVIRLLG